MDKIEELKHELYIFALTKTINDLETSDKVKWPIEYNFDLAYIDLQNYYKDKNKSIHALEKLGNKEDCYFILREKIKVKQY